MNEYRLEQLFDLQMGKTPSRNESSYWLNGLHDWISIRDLSNSSKYISETNEKLSDIAVKESGIRIIPKDTVIMSFKLSIGKVAITSHDMYSNEAIMAFHDKKVVEILPEYLYYLLLGKNWDEGSNKAVMGITLNKATLSIIKIRMHDIVNQVQITSILDNLDKQINNKKKQLTEYDQLIKSRFVEMFGDIIRNDKKWSSASLNDLATVGSSKRIYQSEYSTQGIPFYRSKEIIELGKNEKPSVELFISKERYKEIKANYGVPKVGDLLITAVGTIGKIWIVDSNSPFYYKDGNIVYIRSNNFNSIFFKQSLLVLIDNFKIKNVAGSAYPALTIEKLKEMIVVKPPMEYQNEFSEFSQQVDKLKFEVQKSLNETQMLFDSLMQEYFG